MAGRGIWPLFMSQSNQKRYTALRETQTCYFSYFYEKIKRLKTVCKCLWKSIIRNTTCEEMKKRKYLYSLSAPRFSLTVTCAGHSYALLYIWANREIETLVGDLPQIPHVLITELEPAESQN